MRTKCLQTSTGYSYFAILAVFLAAQYPFEVRSGEYGYYDLSIYSDKSFEEMPSVVRNMDGGFIFLRGRIGLTKMASPILPSRSYWRGRVRPCEGSSFDRYLDELRQTSNLRPEVSPSPWFFGTDIAAGDETVFISKRREHTFRGISAIEEVPLPILNDGCWIFLATDDSRVDITSIMEVGKLELVNVYRDCNQSDMGVPRD